MKINKTVSYLQRLQNLPKETRKWIMWLAIGIIMFFIFILWLFVLLPQNPAFKQKQENGSLSELKSQLQEGFRNFEEIRKQFSEIKEQYLKEKEEPLHDKTDRELETEKPRLRLPLE